MYAIILAMQVAVIADSHDNLNMIHRAVQFANQRQCQALLVLGDLVSPFAMTALKAFQGRIYGVYGNNDGDRLRLQQAANLIGADFTADPRCLELDGKRILMMHEPFLLEEAAASGRYDYVLYGHLHKIDQRQLGACRIVNPGELGGWLSQASLVLLDLDRGTTEAIHLDRGQ